MLPSSCQFFQWFHGNYSLSAWDDSTSLAHSACRLRNCFHQFGGLTLCSVVESPKLRLAGTLGAAHDGIEPPFLQLHWLGFLAVLLFPLARSLLMVVWRFYFGCCSRWYGAAPSPVTLAGLPWHSSYYCWFGEYSWRDGGGLAWTFALLLARVPLMWTCYRPSAAAWSQNLRHNVQSRFPRQ